MILVIDNYDSFTYNLVQYLGMCGANVRVVRNDEVTADEIVAMRPDGILLSPGPCRPTEAGVCTDVSRLALADNSPLAGTPLFGVCLGHQAIGMVAGAEVGRAATIMHGKTSLVRHDGEGLFQGLPNPMRAVRYHSLSVNPQTLPPGFIVSATAEDDGEVMGIRHTIRPIEGLQFHPESVLTQDGIRILQNFVARVQG